MPYVPAIDGLRAIAVALVLLFHAKVPLLSGGYIGVDVFFVISGYLIAGLIFQQHAARRFSLIDFYERRIRRIFPALLLVLFVTLALAALIMLPPDLMRLGSSAAAAALFVANFYFWKQRLNYLQDNPDFEPLLHTWSLAIEEQFYLFFPIFLVALLRRWRRADLVLLGVGLASLAISVALSTTHPRAAFYFSASRAWELLLGAWLAVANVRTLVPHRVVPPLQVAGLTMIVASAATYGKFTPFPGLAALVPCLGTALLIAWSDVKTYIVDGLGHPILVWLGLISYPLYLWHWPLLVLARLELLREPAPSEIALIYVAALGLAAATWHYFEKPIRARKDKVSPVRLFAIAAGFTGLAVTVGLALPVAQERIAAPPPAVAHIVAAAKDFAPSRAACHNWDRKRADQFDACVMGKRERPAFDFALWGDSHAGHIAGAVDAVGRDLSLKGLQITSDNCLPLLGVEVVLNGAVTDCTARNEAAFTLLRQHAVRRVFLAGAWVQYIDSADMFLRTSDHLHREHSSSAILRRQLIETVRRLRDIGIAVVIVGPVPEIGWNVPSVLAASEWRGRPPPLGPKFEDYLEQQRQVLPALKEAASAGATIIYPHERLCNATCIVRNEQGVLYSDTEHLTTAGADLLCPLFLRQLSPATAPP